MSRKLWICAKWVYHFSVVRVNPRVVRVNPSIVRVNPSIVRVNPSNSQLRSLCHGLLYYGGHAVVTWHKGCTSLSGWSRNDFVAETPDPRTQMYRWPSFVLRGARSIFLQSCTRTIGSRTPGRGWPVIACIFDQPQFFAFFVRLVFGVLA